MPPGGLSRCNASSNALLPASLGPTKIVLPGSISKKPVSRMLRYFLTRAFRNRIDSPPVGRKFLEKSRAEYDTNPKNLIHRFTHVVHKSRSWRRLSADLDDWAFDTRDRRFHCPPERKWNQARGRRSDVPGVAALPPIRTRTVGQFVRL